MKNVHIRRVFTLSLTADDWALYRYDNDGALMTENRDAAAREINRVAEEALNNADLTFSDTRDAIEAVLDKYWELGAADTEGRAVMYELLLLSAKAGEKK